MTDSEPAEPEPVSIERDDEAIRITWSDATTTRWTAGQLRRACPCATCREKRSSGAKATPQPARLPVLSAEEARPLRVETMKPVGNYAYNVVFSDGHHSGIYQLSMLHDGPEQHEAEHP